jgi:hypothetical protein
MMLNETELEKVSGFLFKEYNPGLQIEIDQIIMVKHGILVLFTLTNEELGIPPVQRVAMFDSKQNCKFDMACV